MPVANRSWMSHRNSAVDDGDKRPKRDDAAWAVMVAARRGEGVQRRVVRVGGRAEARICGTRVERATWEECEG